MAERTPWSLSGALRGMFAKKTIDEDTWDDLEAALIMADFGPDVTDEILESLRDNVERHRTTDPADLKRMLRETLEERFSKLDSTLFLSNRPAVVLVVGVNGVGKTTTRSEEHTSELQSRQYLVCRLLLEKKTNN